MRIYNSLKPNHKLKKYIDDLSLEEANELEDHLP